MTLTQRLEEGRLPVAEALRLAMSLAEALRLLHDRGEVYGALTPASVELTDRGLRLVPAASGARTARTPYTAPEVSQGRQPDAQADIFAFGAILFEMLTGRRAFEQDTITERPATSGSAAADRVIGPCLVRNPEARARRMQRVILEVKLLAVAVRRAQASSARQREMQKMEARIGARLASQMRTHENTVAEAAALKRQLSALRSQLAAVQERVGVLAGIERTLEDMKQYSRQFEQTLGADLMALGQAIKAQSAAIESAREGLSRTDFLVERVVETLESLQNAVLDSGKPDEEISLVN